MPNYFIEQNHYTLVGKLVNETAPNSSDKYV